MPICSQYISAEQGVGRVRFSVILKVDGGITGFSCFISEILPGEKKCHIQKVKHIKFYLLEKFGVSDIESPNYL